MRNCGGDAHCGNTTQMTFIGKLLRQAARAIGYVPKRIRDIVDKLLPATTRVLKLLDSDLAREITELIPGNLDDNIRMGLVVALREFEAALKAVKAGKTRNTIMGMVAARAVEISDGRQLHPDEYKEMFQQVYKENETHNPVLLNA